MFTMIAASGIQANPGKLLVVVVERHRQCECNISSHGTLPMLHRNYHVLSSNIPSLTPIPSGKKLEWQRVSFQSVE